MFLGRAVVLLTLQPVPVPLGRSPRTAHPVAALGRRELLSSALVAPLVSLVAPVAASAEGEVEVLAVPAVPAPELLPEPARPPPPPHVPPPPPRPSAFDFDVPFRGEPVEASTFLGKATVVVNVKFDDPETLDQMPALQSMFGRLNKDGLNVLAFPTDQGWFEADDSNTLRLKFKSVYGFGQYPKAVVFDKSDLLGQNALPLFAWMTKSLSNPWGVKRLVFNYEKFLLDADGLPLRREYRPQAPDLGPVPASPSEGSRWPLRSRRLPT